MTGQVEFQPGIPWMRNPDEGEQRRNPGQVLKSSRVPGDQVGVMLREAKRRRSIHRSFAREGLWILRLRAG